MSDDLTRAITAALTKRADDTDLPRRPDNNNPFQPERRRAPRQANPEKWAPPPYRDREAERLAGRLSKKGRKP